MIKPKSFPAPGPHQNAIRHSARYARSAFMDTKYQSVFAKPILNSFRRAYAATPLYTEAFTRNCSNYTFQKIKKFYTIGCPRKKLSKFWRHIAQKVTRIWQYPFVEQDVTVFLTCVPNISKIHWFLHSTCMEPFFPPSLNVVHTHVVLLRFKVILAKICLHCLIRF